MTTLTDTLRDVPSPGRGDWKETLGRVGLVGKGALYALVGLLAVQLAAGDVATDASKVGAIEWLSDQPFGQVLLVALTIALFAMAAWRLLDAIVGDPVEGDDAKDRVRFAGKGALYLGVAIVTLTSALDSSSGTAGSGGGGSGDQQQQQATATVFDWPGGRWIVLVGGVGLIGYALYMLKRHTVDGTFLERLDVGSSSWVALLGRIGYAARSMVLVLIGWFLVQAAVTYDAKESKGISGSLKELAGESWGPLALWGVAVGLVGYGMFNLAEARYRRAA